jgi:hypothetical protein
MIEGAMPSSCFKYVSSDVPAGKTLDEYRRHRVRRRRRSLLARLRARRTRAHKA